MKKILLFSILASSTLLFSCKKDKKEEPETPPVNNTPAYTVPTTYNFSNTDLSSSSKRIAMLGELTTYIRITHTVTPHDTLDPEKLKNMYNEH
jgi:hypothetical protein